MPDSTVLIVDSHTGGEPTRLVLEGGPDLGEGPLDERVTRFRTEFDHWRSAIVNEPRGSNALVGALLCPPGRPDCQYGVIFFNNVGYLGMCGHGMMGVIAALAHLGRITPGAVKIDTPVGAVEATLHPGGEVSVENVPSYRTAKQVVVQVPGLGQVCGDVAWGGNWFYLIEQDLGSLEVGNLEDLIAVAAQLREAIHAHGFSQVDHVELFGPSPTGAHSRSFVLCPGHTYDRSPCGTGTSAKLACLAADGKLAPGEEWVQESVVGSRFTGSYRWLDRATGVITPTITGRAYVTGRGSLYFDPADPFGWGIRP